MVNRYEGLNQHLCLQHFVRV